MIEDFKYSRVLAEERGGTAVEVELLREAVEEID